MHTPVRQCAEPRHAVKQLPQKLSSLSTSTQLPLQIIRGAAHIGTHAPATQLSEPPHAVPH